jgi:ParB family transcriptional regulator, chromosome partitioning protein
VLTQIPVVAVEVGERMRELDEGKVLELMQSYEQVGQINPISVDEDYALIAGAHRLEAAKILGGRPSRQRSSTKRTSRGN